MGIKRVRELPSVQAARVPGLRGCSKRPDRGGHLCHTFSEKAEVPKKPARDAGQRTDPDFPTLFENDRSKFVFILNGGAGIYSDTNPWFGGYGELFNKGSPISDDPVGPGDFDLGARDTWSREWGEFFNSVITPSIRTEP